MAGDPIPIHGADHCPTGPDPIPCLSTGSAHWATIWTYGLGYENVSAGSAQFLDMFAVFIPPGASEFFGYYRDVGAGQGGLDRFFLTMKQSGLYTFTQHIQTADLPNSPPAPYDFEYQTRLRVLGRPAADSGTPTLPDTYPGQIGSDPLLQDREQLRIKTTAGDDLILSRSWTVPVAHPDPPTERRTCELKLGYSPGNDEFWNAWVTIVRHGDLDGWPDDDFLTPTASF